MTRREAQRGMGHRGAEESGENMALARARAALDHARRGMKKRLTKERR